MTTATQTMPVTQFRQTHSSADEAAIRGLISQWSAP